MEYTEQGTSEVSAFFVYMFYMRDVAHLTHLYQPDRTLATHKALNMFYDEILDLTDTLIETYQGVHGLIYTEIPKSAPTNTPIAFLKEAYEYIEKNRMVFPSTHIQNIIDEICALVSKTLFLLQFVQ